MASTVHRGGCFCGAVLVEATGAPAVMGFRHCESCRRWLAAPLHGFTLCPAENPKVVASADRLGLYERTEQSQRRFFTNCGAAVRVGQASIGLTDVVSVVIPDFDFRPTLHVHYGEEVISIRDGLPEYRDTPKELGGSGETLPE